MLSTPFLKVGPHFDLHSGKEVALADGLEAVCDQDDINYALVEKLHTDNGWKYHFIGFPFDGCTANERCKRLALEECHNLCTDGRRCGSFDEDITVDDTAKALSYYNCSTPAVDDVGPKHISIDSLRVKSLLMVGGLSGLLSVFVLCV